MIHNHGATAQLSHISHTEWLNDVMDEMLHQEKEGQNQDSSVVEDTGNTH